MSINDEELQDQIEKSTSAIEGVEAQAYKRVFDALKKEPDFYLSASFADKVVAKMEARKESSRDFIWIGAGVVSFIIAAIVSVVLTDFKLNFGAFKFIAGYPGLVAFGIVFILALQWVDKKLVRS
jgi:hypothetical protein